MSHSLVLVLTLVLRLGRKFPFLLLSTSRSDHRIVCAYVCFTWDGKCRADQRKGLEENGKGRIDLQFLNSNHHNHPSGDWDSSLLCVLCWETYCNSMNAQRYPFDYFSFMKMENFDEDYLNKTVPDLIEQCVWVGKSVNPKNLLNPNNLSDMDPLCMYQRVR